jgi:hypothetical protein
MAYFVGLDDTATTLMIRCLPRNITIDTLIELLNRTVGSTRYDFVCLPWDMQRNSNMNMAFVNFVDNASAQHLYKVFDGLELPGGRTTDRITTCRVCQSKTQGLQANLANSAVACSSQLSFGDTDFSPRVFENGIRISLLSAINKYVTAEDLQKASLAARIPKRQLQQLKLTSATNSLTSGVGESFIPIMPQRQDTLASDATASADAPWPHSCIHSRAVTPTPESTRNTYEQATYQRAIDQLLQKARAGQEINVRLLSNQIFYL